MKQAPHKVLFYTDTELYGGAEHQMYLLAKNLNTQYFQPILVCRSAEVLLPWQEKFQNLNIPTLAISSKSKHSLKNFFDLNKILQEEKPDLIHIHVWNPMAGKYAILAASLRKIPIIITEHDPFKLNFLKRVYKNWALKKVQKIITVSEANQSLMAELYPSQSKKIAVVHNGIELAKDLSEQRILNIRKTIFKTGPQNRVIFSAGTLHERKGFKYLISAFQKISLKFPDSKLIIAGEGPERPFLENLIENLNLGKKILLLGLRDDVPDLMRASNLFVLPSLKEAFGLVILEAIDAKLPIIATKVGGIPEIIDQENSILVKPANKNELLKAINKLFNQPKLAQKLAISAQSRLKLFSAETTAKNTAKIYSQLIDSTQPKK